MLIIIFINLLLLSSWLCAIQSCVLLCLASFVGHGKAQIVTSDYSNQQTLKKPACLQLDRDTLLHFVAQFE